MPYSSDPRLRQTLDDLNGRLQTWGETIQQALYRVQDGCVQTLQPCCIGLQSCLEASCQPCFTARDDSRRHARAPVSHWRGRDATGFEFYNEWDDDADGWGDDELDALLAGPSQAVQSQQPRRNRGMLYGYGATSNTAAQRARGTSLSSGGHALDDAMVPQSSMFGFLQSLPWKIGGRGARYAPRPATLKTNVGKERLDPRPYVPSGEIASSMSSRDDLFPSDSEGDALEIDDDYAVMMLARRDTGMSNDRSSDRTRSSQQKVSVPSKAESGDAPHGRQRSDTDSSRSLGTPRSPGFLMPISPGQPDSADP